MLQAYRDHVAERAALGIPPLPLSAKQTGELVEMLKNPPAGEEAFLVELLTHRHNSLHEAHHATMECLGTMIWESQRAGRPPDGDAYIACVQRHATQL